MKKQILSLFFFAAVMPVAAQNMFFGETIPKPINASNQSFLSYWLAQDSGDEFILVSWDNSPPSFAFCQFDFAIGLRHYNGADNELQEYVNTSSADVIIGTCSMKDGASCYQVGESLKKEALKHYGRYTDSASGTQATSYIWEYEQYFLAVEIDLVENTVSVIYLTNQ